MRTDDSLDARLALEAKRRDTCRERKEERAESGLDERGKGKLTLGLNFLAKFFVFCDRPFAGKASRR